VVRNIPGIVITFAVGLAIVTFVVAAFGSGDDNALYRAYDVREVFAYQKEYLRAALLEGRLPMWNPHTFSGSAFLANPQTQVFYPSSILYLWLSQPTALLVELTLHLLLAAAGTFALARHSYGISRGSAVFAALAYCLSGTVFGHVFRGHPHIIMSLAYIPLLAMVVDRGAGYLAIGGPQRHSQSGRRPVTRPARFARVLAGAGPWPWLAGLLLALQILTGGLQIVWLGLLFIGLSRLVRWLVNTPFDWRGGLREGLLLAAIGLIGLGLAAAQIGPAAELAELSNRPAHDYGYAAESSFRPALLVTLFHPRATPDEPIAPGGNYGYVGVLVALLALWGFVTTLRDRQLAALWLVGGFFFLLMLGKNSFLFPLLFKFVPSFDVFRAPARAMTIVHLVTSLLAAIGLDAMLRILRDRWRQPRWLTPAVVICVCLISWLDLVGAARWQAEALDFAEQQSLDDPVQRIHAETLERDRSWYRYWFYPNALRDNHAYAIGARSVGGYDVMLSGRYERFIRFMTDSAAEPGGLTRLNPKTFVNSPSAFPFKVLGVKYADYRGQLVTRADKRTPSRGWFVRNIKPVANEVAALRSLRSEAFNPYDEVILETVESQPQPATAGVPSATPRVTISDVSPEHLMIEVGPHPAGYLVLSEIYYPGWQAEGEGQTFELVRCNSILRCLRLAGSADSIRINMTFRPTILRRGTILSCISLVLVFCGLGFVYRRSFA
jgi:hypothetical protein